MGDQDGIDFNGASTGDDYCVLPDGRVPLWVMLTVGDDAQRVTPWHTHQAPLILSAAVIGRDCTIPAGEATAGSSPPLAAGANHCTTSGLCTIHDCRAPNSQDLAPGDVAGPCRRAVGRQRMHCCSVTSTLRTRETGSNRVGRVRC